MQYAALASCAGGTAHQRGVQRSLLAAQNGFVGGTADALSLRAWHVALGWLSSASRRAQSASWSSDSAWPHTASGVTRIRAPFAFDCMLPCACRAYSLQTLRFKKRDLRRCRLRSEPADFGPNRQRNNKNMKTLTSCAAFRIAAATPDPLRIASAAAEHAVEHVLPAAQAESLQRDATRPCITGNAMS